VNTSPPSHRHGYFIVWRTDEFLDLLRVKPNAFRLLCLIAYRARYREGVSVNGLAQGECWLGKDDVKTTLKLSPREYRTAKTFLKTAKLATFKATNLHTVARLEDSRVFSIVAPKDDHPNDKQNDRQPTSKRQASDTKEECNQDRTPRREGGGPEILSPSEQISLEKRREELKSAIHTLKERVGYDSMGSMPYSPKERDERKRLKDDLAVVEERLGIPHSIRGAKFYAPSRGNKPNPQRVDRNIGTANEGTAHLY